MRCIQRRIWISAVVFKVNSLALAPLPSSTTQETLSLLRLPSLLVFSKPNRSKEHRLRRVTPKSNFIMVMVPVARLLMMQLVTSKSPRNAQLAVLASEKKKSQTRCSKT